MSAKQLIIVRNDLRSKLRHGKLAAQVAHASMAVFLKGRHIEVPHGFTDPKLVLDLNQYQHEWIEGAFTKIVLRCDNFDHMMAIQTHCDIHAIPQFMINDAGRTVFKEPTHTCLGVGPWDSVVLDMLFGDLKMYW